MTHVNDSPGFDPYRPLGPNLKRGDRLNRRILLRPHRRIVQLLKGQRVLDVCCGTGNLTAMLVAAGCQAVGVDSSFTMLSHARQKHVPAEFLQMDAARLPFQNEFDDAVIGLALHEMPPLVRDQVWESMRRAVRPGGRLVALDFAVPLHRSLLARVAGALVEQDERAFLHIYPAHYENYREFMRAGGLLAWIRAREKRLEAEYRFWGGVMAVVACGV